MKYESHHHSDSFSLPYHLSSTIPFPWIVKQGKEIWLHRLYCYVIQFRSSHSSIQVNVTEVHIFIRIHTAISNPFPLREKKKDIQDGDFHPFFCPRMLFDEERVKRGFAWRKYYSCSIHSTREKRKEFWVRKGRRENGGTSFTLLIHSSTDHSVIPLSETKNKTLPTIYIRMEFPLLSLFYPSTTSTNIFLQLNTYHQMEFEEEKFFLNPISFFLVSLLILLIQFVFLIFLVSWMNFWWTQQTICDHRDFKERKKSCESELISLMERKRDT